MLPVQIYGVLHPAQGQTQGPAAAAASCKPAVLQAIASLHPCCLTLPLRALHAELCLLSSCYCRMLQLVRPNQHPHDLARTGLAACLLKVT
jgi:hypothetical protein